MAKKIKLTRPELKRQRDSLGRFQRYLPMLKLKQQQLQVSMRETMQQLAVAERAATECRQTFSRYEAILAYSSGLNVRTMAAPAEVKTSRANIAGVTIPVFDSAVFPAAEYSLFATPAWVDQALADLRKVNEAEARCTVLREQYRLLGKALTKIIQRVNLFERIKIPEAKSAIHVIRIHLGDEMTAAVGRAKIAKGKLADVTGARKVLVTSEGADADEGGQN
jgi:V/A-type H+-transporting ATPase subunit D